MESSITLDKDLRRYSLDLSFLVTNVEEINLILSVKTKFFLKSVNNKDFIITISQDYLDDTINLISIYSTQGKLYQSYIDKRLSAPAFIITVKNLSWFIDIKEIKILKTEVKTIFSAIFFLLQAKPIRDFLTIFV